MIGGYQIVSFLGQGRWGPVFAAVAGGDQIAPWGSRVLEPDRAADEAQKQRFIADARSQGQRAASFHPLRVRSRRGGPVDLLHA